MSASLHLKMWLLCSIFLLCKKLSWVMATYRSKCWLLALGGLNVALWVVGCQGMCETGYWLTVYNIVVILDWSGAWSLTRVPVFPYLFRFRVTTLNSWRFLYPLGSMLQGNLYLEWGWVGVEIKLKTTQAFLFHVYENDICFSWRMSYYAVMFCYGLYTLWDVSLVSCFGNLFLCSWNKF
jgi:hypothetical protein